MSEQEMAILSIYAIASGRLGSKWTRFLHDASLDRTYCGPETLLVFRHVEEALKVGKTEAIIFSWGQPMPRTHHFYDPLWAVPIARPPRSVFLGGKRVPTSRYGRLSRRHSSRA